MLAGGERLGDHGEMHARRGADVDHVNIVHGEQVVEIGDPTFDAEFITDLGEALRVEVAERQNLELVRVGQIALDDVRTADAATDDGDVKNAAHFTHSVPCSALAWAVSAIFMAL